MTARKEIGIAPIIVGILMVVLGTFVFFILPSMLQSTTNLRIGDGVFKAQIVADQSGRSKGLVGVAKLDPTQALLMVFPSQKAWEVSMRGIVVPIDIIWINSDKRIVYIVKNVSIDDATPSAFSPKFPAKYVVELPAGTVDGKAIETGKVASFQINIQGS